MRRFLVRSGLAVTAAVLVTSLAVAPAAYADPPSYYTKYQPLVLDSQIHVDYANGAGAEVMCNTGDTATGGGFDASGATNEGVIVLRSSPAGSALQGWGVSVVWPVHPDPNVLSTTVGVFVTCTAGVNTGLVLPE